MLVQSQISTVKPSSSIRRIRSTSGKSRRIISTQTASVKGLLGTARTAYGGLRYTCLVARSPRRRPRVADIAAQSGLSRATVDRVLHGREGVRPETVAQVERAVAELERQRTQVQLPGGRSSSTW